MRKYFLYSILTVLLTACMFSEPWSQKRTDGIRQAFCVEQMGELPDSHSCECFVQATQKEYKTFTAFARSNGPSEKYRKALLWCGYIIK